jgi:hypothetical protein
MKNATPRNSASPPSHANSFTPMNCSQLMAGSILRGGAGDNCSGVAWAKTGGGTATGGIGGMMTGFGVSNRAGGVIPDCGTGAGDGGAGAVTGSDLGLDSLSCLSRMISNSSSPSRRASSSRRFRVLTARTISHTASARGTPRIKKTTGIQSIRFAFQQPRSLMPCSVRPAGGFWQAALRRRTKHQMKFSYGNDTGFPCVPVN